MQCSFSLVMAGVIAQCKETMASLILPPVSCEIRAFIKSVEIGQRVLEL